MEYFEQLGLSREPFSNSPDPDFLYYSSQHIACLQELEISVRLRRGLNVVIGEVGTGKTTLIRRFIKNLGSDDSMCLHLLLDPYFKTPHAFLRMLCAQVMGEMPDRRLNVYALKEMLKKELYERGVEQDVATVLIVDEGQKMTSECLEVLRELLNYETNNKKLLQILLFGQTELAPILKGMENLADRINSYMELKPMGFRETRRMINYRLALATPAGEETPRLLTGPAFLAIHRATKGYPRKVVRLCHKIILGLLIRKRKRANWWLVNAVVREEMRQSWRPRPLALAGAAALVLLCAGLLAVRYVPEVRSLAQGIESSVAATFTSEADEPSPFAPSVEASAKPMPVKREAVAEEEVAPAPAESVTLEEYFADEARKAPKQVAEEADRVEVDRVDVDAAAVALGVVEPEPDKQVEPASEPVVVPLAEPKVTVQKVETQEAPSEPVVATEKRKQSRVEPIPVEQLIAEGIAAARAEQAAGTEVAASVVRKPAEAGVITSAAALPPALEPAVSGVYYELPEVLGKLPIMPEESLSNLIRGVYGVYDKTNLKKVLAANPQIKNVNDIPVGKPLTFPVIEPIERGLAQSLAWVRLTVERKLDAAFGRLRAASQFGHASRLLPYIAADGGLAFAVVLERPCETLADAEKVRSTLPLSLQKGAGVMLTPNPDVSLGQMNDLAMSVLQAKFEQ